MKEHLVRNHLGGYYITDGSPEEIEEPCTICDDSDEVLITWEQGDEIAQYEALSHYLCLNKYRLEEALVEYGKTARKIERIIRKVELGIVTASDYQRFLISDLEDSKKIPKEMARRLKIDVSVREQEQILFARNFDYSQLGFNDQKKETTQKKAPAQKKLAYKQAKSKNHQSKI